MECASCPFVSSAPRHFGKNPETLPEQLCLQGGTFSKAAAIPRFNSLRWNVSEAADLLCHALALKKEYPDHLSQLLDFIDSGERAAFGSVSGGTAEAAARFANAQSCDFFTGEVSRAPPGLSTL